MTVRDDAPARVWTIGQVADRLQVPPVTLRTWDRRYGAGPSHRDSGKHRRYTRADIARLEAMQRLILAGTPARDAARISQVTVISSADKPDLTADERSAVITTAAAELRVDRLGTALDECLESLGVEAAWSDVLAPAVRSLGRRWLRQGDCIEVEHVLTTSIGYALDRFLVRNRLMVDAPRPLLLVTLPDDHHALPLRVLHATLLAAGTPAVMVGPGLPLDAIVDAVRRLEPAAVVAWAFVPGVNRHEQLARLRATDRPAIPAGPGWPSRTRPLMTLSTALTSLADFATEQR